MQEVFKRRIEPVTDMDAARTVRRDVVTMTRWDVGRDAALAVAQTAYGIARLLLGPFVAVVLGAFIVGRGPLQSEIILVAAATIVFVITAILDTTLLPEKVEARLYTIWLGGIVAGVVTIILLAVHPAHGLAVYEAFGIVIGSLGLTLIAVPASHMIIARFSSLLQGIVELAALALAAVTWHYVILRNLGLMGWPDWISRTLRVGAVAWFSATLALVSINMANVAFSRVLGIRKLRKAPEAEFVESALSAMSSIEKAMKPDANESNRWQAVQDIEYLAAVLDIYVGAVLASQDPRSRSIVAENLYQRAEAIRIHKRALLFGRPKAHSEALDALTTAVVYSAHRDWLALPAVSGGEAPPEPRGRRVTRIAGQIAMIAIPVALGFIAWRLDQKGLIPFAVLWTLVSLLDMVRPGAGRELTESATNAKTSLPDIKLPDIKP